MTVSMSREEARVLELFQLRNRLLTAISKLSASIPTDAGQHPILEQCCNILTTNRDYCLVWAGKYDDNGTVITPLAAKTSSAVSSRDCLDIIDQIHFEIDEGNPASKALLTGQPIIVNNFADTSHAQSMKNIALKSGVQSCSSWPLLYNEKKYGVLNIYSQKPHFFTALEIDFLANVVADISLAIYSHETQKRLLIERDFNQEIVDTVQALLVSISPCGMILSFNKEAEAVTGYRQDEVINKYWVDILLSSEERGKSQQEFTEMLKSYRSKQVDRDYMNFQATLLTKNNQKKIIKWHGSIRPDIEQSKVGLVLFGVDVTKKIETDKALTHAIRKWENIFNAIQDPAIIVSSDSTILDANSATFTAARKTADEIIGKKVCQILHGGRPADAVCPLEVQINVGQSRILETELRGLNGHYLLTISPLSGPEGNINRTLLVARDLSDEEMMRAESIRTGQLASIGELAAGVAHEINNPINSIINYSRIIMDDPEDKDNIGYLQHIVTEGKRIAAIVSNLLDFARQRDESPEPIHVQRLISDSLELISHQLKKDGIHYELHIPETLPQVICNQQQIQQVLLNIISNARYSLNKKYPSNSPNKLMKIECHQIDHENKPYVNISITDFGTGIEHDIMDRLFDPFFSTKPKGEGTGLGLSISHGLVRDNKGFLFINSELGEFTSLIIDLPLADNGGNDVY